MLPSRFLEDIPEDLYRGNISLGYEQRGNYDLSSYQWNNTYGSPSQRKPEKPSKTRELRFFFSFRVKHPVYGEGLVRKSRLEFGDETVEVYFEGLGLKALVASMSSLEILEA